MLDVEGAEWQAQDVQLGEPDVPGFEGTLRLPLKQTLPACPGSGSSTGVRRACPAGSRCCCLCAFLQQLAPASGCLCAARAQPRAHPIPCLLAHPAAPVAEPAAGGGVTLTVQLFGGLTNVTFLDSLLELLPGNVKWSVLVEEW